MIELTDFFTIQVFEPIDEYQNDESESRSLIFRQRTQTGQRFEFMLTSTPQKLAGINRIMGGINAIRSEGDFNVKISGLTVDTGITNKTLAAPVAIGDNTATLNNVNNVKVGSYFKFAGHGKVYQVVSITGNTIKFWPNAVRASESGAVAFNNFAFTMRLRGRVQRYSMDGRRALTTVRINCVESF